MQSLRVIDKEEEQQMDLPPGFRFHPTDEELITHYLLKKVIDTNFSARAIGEVDLNKSEPWELPTKAKLGVKEWYFFCMRNKKYPTGLRTNRATEAGYWKATGKDKEIYRGKSLVGTKKTLVFYKGRAPKGDKSNWVMHEYRLDGKYSLHNLPTTAKNEWVICRAFLKSSGGKRIPISGLMRLGSFDANLDSSILPPLMDSSSKTVSDSAYMPCFSNPMSTSNNEEQIKGSFNNSPFGYSPNYSNSFSIIQFQNSLCNSESVETDLDFRGSLDHSVRRDLLENNDSNMGQSLKTEEAFDYQEDPSASAGTEDYEHFWSCLT